MIDEDLPLAIRVHRRVAERFALDRDLKLLRLTPDGEIFVAKLTSAEHALAVAKRWADTYDVDLIDERWLGSWDEQGAREKGWIE